MQDLFKPRVAFKPFEYPITEKFVDAINQSYWTHKEWNFTKDIHEYKVELTNVEREVIKRCLLLISQVEVSVKTFWGELHMQLPKPEIHLVGATFAESECRHERAYSHLLEMLGMNEEFEKIYDIPAIIDRHNYLKRYKDYKSTNIQKVFLKSIILFTLFIENVSLFSQFFIIQSFNKHQKKLQDINNVVAATSKEESIHGEFGMWLINEIRNEHPDFFNMELEFMVHAYCHKALEAESKVLDWIFEHGDTNFIKKEVVLNFIKNRLNESLKGIRMNPIFTIDNNLLKEALWFSEDLYSSAHVDFFNQRPVGYSRKNRAITASDLF